MDPLESIFYFTEEFRRFVEGLLGVVPSLIFLVGLQGVGKTRFLRVLERFLLEKRKNSYYWRWKKDNDYFFEACRGLRVKNISNRLDDQIVVKLEGVCSD